MYYEPGVTPHGLPFDPFKSCVVPRPIGWISTVDGQGRHNLAPYSQFQNISFDPPIVMFSANQDTTGNRKDSVRNADEAIDVNGMVDVLKIQPLARMGY